MRVQHGTSVLVTDGRKALFFRNEGDGDYPDLRLVRQWEQPLPPDRELTSDAPGRSFSSAAHGQRRSSYEHVSVHDQAEADFALGAAKFLDATLQASQLKELVIVAPPRTLGLLRKHLSRGVSDRVTIEIDKELVKHPTSSIERLITAHSGPE